MKEIILPSRRFCTMRPITWFDWVATAAASSTDMRVLLTACRAVLIDGKPLSIEEASAMQMHEAGPIIRAVIAEVLLAYSQPEEEAGAESRPVLQ